MTGRSVVEGLLRWSGTGALARLRGWLLTRGRTFKSTVLAISDGFAFCLVAAFVVWRPSQSTESTFIASVAAPALGSLVAGTGLGLYRSTLRFIDRGVFVLGFLACAIGAIMVLALAANLSHDTLLSSLAFLSTGTLWVAGTRFVGSVLLRSGGESRLPVLIYGAGEAGARLARALLDGRGYEPVAFVDDKSSLWGRKVQGVAVFPSEEVGALLARSGARLVLLALPSLSSARRSAILASLEQYSVHVQTVPDLSDVVSGKAQIANFQEVRAEDVLAREPIPPMAELMDGSIRGRAVMVTGAGGSIGSELCRQIVELAPKTLVLFDISEAALYSIDISLRESNRGANVEIVPVIGSAQDSVHLKEIIQTYRIETLYHCAAYKHVPLVEYNVIEGVRNNVFGTLRTALAAESSGVSTFVLISSDKAVAPSSIMGATKRISELILQGLHSRGSRTRFCMVRFGNVLESSGSVIPRFRAQILKGGPVTVTHEDVERYFMTVEEAAQLVLQAGSMAHGGDVLVLDMGAPIRIHDLARRVIRLMGRTVKGEVSSSLEIEIQITGLRPGERLNEQLFYTEDVMETSHPRILRSRESPVLWEAVNGLIHELELAIDDRDVDLLRELLLHHEEIAYAPSNGIDDLVFRRRAMGGV